MEDIFFKVAQTFLYIALPLIGVTLVGSGLGAILQYFFGIKEGSLATALKLIGIFLVLYILINFATEELKGLALQGLRLVSWKKV